MLKTNAEKEFRRVTARVKACEGIPTDLLEGAFIEDPRVRDLLTELVASVKPRERSPFGAIASAR